MNIKGRWIALLAVAPLFGQMPQGLDLNALKQQLAGSGAASALSASTGLPSSPNRVLSGDTTGLTDDQVQAQRDALIQALKAREGSKAARFASDLFDTHQVGNFVTDGGVSEDYVLGAGDQIYLNATGSANFDFAVPLDGRGTVALPKVGNARVAGLTLGKAREVIRNLVNQKFSRTDVDVQVVQLREIRVSLMGEVYLPGSYLVPSLASLVNVLSLAGGPTAVGSYRDIRVVRGGRVVFHLDLYPLRAEGLGNPNFALQSGDIIFVPIAQDQIVLEGAFMRVAHQLQPAGDLQDTQADSYAHLHRESLVQRIQAIQTQLRGGQPSDAAPAAAANGAALSALAGEASAGGMGGATLAQKALTEELAAGAVAPAAPPAPPLDEAARRQLTNQLLILNDQLAQLDKQADDDHRVQINPLTGRPVETSDPNMPGWLKRWRETGVAPSMVFEMRPGETVADAVAFAGGFLPEVGVGTLTIRRRDAQGSVNAISLAATPSAMAAQAVQGADTVSALPQQETLDRVVHVAGWARVPGDFARADGLRVGDLLKRDRQILPDTYLARGEIVRTRQDGSTSYLAFDVTKALAGDPASDVLLEDRDTVNLYQVGDRRLPKLVTVMGPVAFPGTFLFHEGMRVSDLIFRAGVLQKGADGLDAELAHTMDGKASQIIHLDLAKLASSDTQSPVGLEDDAVNPLLQPDDQLSFFSKPDFLTHRTIQFSGQVAHPGSYALEDAHETLGHLLKRVGGVTADAMPQGAILLRQVGSGNTLQSLVAGTQDPISDGINEVLSRLNETKRNPIGGNIQDSPILHRLVSGDLTRLVIDFPAILKGDAKADLELMDGDQIIIPRRMQAAYVVGETASPFAAFRVEKGMTVRDLLKRAGGPTRNADTWNIRLMKADGRIIDSWVMGKNVEPGDALIVPQKIRRDTTWQENLQTLTPLALILNAVK